MNDVLPPTTSTCRLLTDVRYLVDDILRRAWNVRAILGPVVHVSGNLPEARNRTELCLVAQTRRAHSAVYAGTYITKHNTIMYLVGIVLIRHRSWGLFESRARLARLLRLEDESR